MKALNWRQCHQQCARTGGMDMQRGIGPWTEIAMRHSAKAVIETTQGDASPPHYSIIDWIHATFPY